MKHFLIEYNRSTGRRHLAEFDEASQAIRQRIIAETENTDPHVEIVVIGAPSLDDLRITHSRYFKAGELPAPADWATSIETV
mgnify:CR=1 FL=1